MSVLPKQLYSQLKELARSDDGEIIKEVQILQWLQDTLTDKDSKWLLDERKVQILKDPVSPYDSFRHNYLTMGSI